MKPAPRLCFAGWTVMCALVLPLQAHALDCPRVPEQTNRDWDVEVKAAIGRIGGVTGAELATRTRSATTDLMGKLPQADKVYLEQMMYASYCSALRDNKALSESEREARIRAYNAELRSTLRENRTTGAAPAPAAADPRDVARRELARIPVEYTGEAFVDSVAKRKQAVALLFLKAGIDPDSTGERGATALMHAAASGDVALVNALLKARASIGLRDQRGDSALDWAAMAGQTETIRLLLARGPDAESVDAALVYAAQLGRREALLVLFERVPDKRKLADKALLGAASTAYIDVDPDGLIDVARLLLQRGADINAVDRDGWSALLFAVNNNRRGMVQFFVESGADVNHRCACSGWLGGGYTPLAMASQRGYGEIADLLLKAGADTGARNNDGETALFIAVAGRRTRIVASLLAKGADANAKNRQGNTPLIMAAVDGPLDTIGALLDAGADLHAKNDFGRTPLAVAVRNGNVDVARLLLQRGARVDDKDADGKTLLVHAEERLKGDERTRMIGVLSQAGAK